MEKSEGFEPVPMEYVNYIPENEGMSPKKKLTEKSSSKHFLFDLQGML